MTDTAKAELAASQKTSDFFRMRSEGYHALAESILFGMAQTLVVACEGLKALRAQDEAFGHVSSVPPYTAYIAAAKNALGELFPEVRDMNEGDFIQYIQRRSREGML